MTAFENSFNWNKESKNLNEAFDNGKSLEKFKEQMAQIEKDVDPRFLDMFREYEKKVSELLMNNSEVISNKWVQEELAIQNARIAGTFEKDSIKLKEAYNKIFWEDFENNDFAA